MDNEPPLTEKQKLDELWYDAESSAKGLAWLLMFAMAAGLILASFIIWVLAGLNN